MKKIILAIIVLFHFLVQNVWSQLDDKIYYVEDKKLNKEMAVDIETVIEDFSQIDGGGKNEKFFLIDIIEKNEFNELYIFPTRYIFEIMFKRPDCYFKWNDIIVYLYTEDYLHVDDSVWLKNVLTETHQVLGTPDFKVSWANDSVIEPIWNTGEYNKITPTYHYDPILLKYTI